MRYVRDIESRWLVLYFGMYLSILMGVYWLFALKFGYFQSYISGLFVFLLAFSSLLLVCATHEIGHFVVLKLKNYQILSIQVWCYLLPIGVKHPKWCSREGALVICLSGPIAGVTGSVLLGYLLFLSIPTVLLLAMIMVICAVALGYKDYKELLRCQA